MAYLARGRDSLKPACVAMLDDDDAGRTAIATLRKSSATGKRILQDEFILNIGEWARTADLDLPSGVIVTEPEDMIPPSVAVEAARLFASRFLKIDDGALSALTVAGLLDVLDKNEGRMWKALQIAFTQAFDGGHVEKVGFNKELVHYLEKVAASSPRPTGLPAFEKNFGALVAFLSDRLRSAADSESDTRQTDRVQRVVTGYLRDNQTGTTRDEANRVLRDVEALLDDGEEHDAIRQGVLEIRRNYRLTVDPLEPVSEFEEFREQLGNLTLRPRLMYRQTLQAKQ